MTQDNKETANQIDDTNYFKDILKQEAKIVEQDMDAVRQKTDDANQKILDFSPRTAAENMEKAQKLGVFAELGKQAINAIGTLGVIAMEHKHPGREALVEMKKQLHEAGMAVINDPEASEEAKDKWYARIKDAEKELENFVGKDMDKVLDHKRKIFDAVVFGATGGMYGLALPFINKNQAVKKEKPEKKEDKG